MEQQKTGGEKRNAAIQKMNVSVDKLKDEIRKVIIGQDEMIELMLTGILTGGHILLEGVPGIAKTLTTKVFSKTLNIGFSRIQFTPDLMPTDVTGTTVFNMKTSNFTFKKGPVFSNVILIDEINRAPAKTQAALMEVMEERQVTMDGKTYPMDYPFLVIATQNPIEQEGTYKLPEAQLDRFLFRVKLTYPTLEEEINILEKFKEDFKGEVEAQVKGILTEKKINEFQSVVEKIYIKDDIIKYIAKVIDGTRNSPDLYLGASPRASLSILKASKAIAAIRGRDFVTPDDVQFVAYHVLNHRVILTPEREMEGITTEEVIKSILEQVEVPR